MHHFAIALTIALTVYGQLIVKWAVGRIGPFPVEQAERIAYFGKLLLNPWILSGMASALLAGLCWMVALSKLELSYAYPFMSVAFVLVTLASAVLFREPVTLVRAAGLALIVAGIVVGSQG